MNQFILLNSRLPMKSLLLLVMICTQFWLSLAFFPKLTPSELPIEDIRLTSSTADKIDALRERLNLDLAALGQLPNIDQRVDRFHNIAEIHNIRIKKINYQRIKMPGDLIRTEMQAELSGTYPSIRSFLRGIESKDPAIATDSIVFSRDSTNADVKAQIKFSVYATNIDKYGSGNSQ